MKIVIISEIQWNFLKQRHHFITEKFDKDDEVIFIERVFSKSPKLSILILKKIVNHFFRKRKNKEIPKLKQVKYLRSFMIPSDMIFFRIFNYLLYRIYYKKFFIDSVIYQFTPMFNFDKNDPKFQVLDIIHNWWDMPWNQNQIKKQLQQKIKNSDLIISDSKSLMSSKQISDYLLIEPGLSSKWYKFFEQKKPVKNTIKNVLFFGNLRENSDQDLIINLSLKGVQIDCFGLIDESLSIKTREHINYKGKKSQLDLLDFINKYDAVLLPYKYEKFSQFISPAKYFECLALKMPILTNSNFNHLKYWENVTLNINNFEDEHSRIFDFLQSNLDEINSFLREQIWESRTDKIYKRIINEIEI